MCFRNGLNGFRMVLGMFWKTFWCRNDDQKAKGGFVEMLVLLRNIHVFNRTNSKMTPDMTPEMTFWGDLLEPKR